MRSARTEAAGCRLSAQQQGGGALHEGGQELRPSRGAVQEGPGAGAGHGDKVRVARARTHMLASPPPRFKTDMKASGEKAKTLKRKLERPFVLPSCFCMLS